jgi:hypothetical protein
MKHYLNLKQITVLSFFLLTGMKLNAQTSEQSRMFFNRTHVAIAKVEKEMYRANDATYGAELKKAVKYQVIALNLWKQNNFKDAVGYSHKARAQCIELCTKMNISEGSYYALNDEEKTYCKPADYASLALKPDLLDPAQTKQIDEVNILDPAKFREIDLNIK